jgi:2'-5' RNA ligase
LNESSLVRAFFAVPSDPAWVDSAQDLLRRLRPELPNASWTRPESWHLTLHFLGEVPRAEADRFAEAIAPRARSTPDVDLEPSGAVIFPASGRARVLAAGFADSTASTALSRLAVSAAALAPSIRSPESETRNRFHPHITFARLRRPWPREAVERYRMAIDAWRPPPFRARCAVLFQSRLDPAGAVHTALATCRFAGSAVELRA